MAAARSGRRYEAARRRMLDEQRAYERQIAASQKARTPGPRWPCTHALPATAGLVRHHSILVQLCRRDRRFAA
jgi:hypothetical protein